MNGLIRAPLTGLEETLEVFDLIDLQTVCLPDGGEKHGFRVLGQEFEQFMSHLHGVLSVRFCLTQEGGDTLVHSVHELINSLSLEVRGDLKQFLPMAGIFDLVFSIKASGVKGHPPAFDPDLHAVSIGQQLSRDS
jgi:hypothetical protein